MVMFRQAGMRSVRKCILETRMTIDHNATMQETNDALI